MTESPHPPAQAPDDLAAVRMHLVIDEATTDHIRGWAFNRTAPTAPAVLRFLLAGHTVWQGACKDSRPDVQRAGYPTDRVGFSFTPSLPCRWSGTLTVHDESGARLPIVFQKETHLGLPLKSDTAEANTAELSTALRPTDDEPITSALHATTHAAAVPADAAASTPTRDQPSENALTGGWMSRFGLGGLLRGGKTRAV